MTKSNTISAIVYKKESNTKQIALVVLNGYNINAGGSLGHIGAMRSFKITNGDLWDAWSTREPLNLITQDGREAEIRIAAHPSGENDAGLIEFL